MTSTRNKNDRGNYKAEECGREDQRLYLMYQNQGNGKAYSNHFAGDGLLPGRMGTMPLSHNFADIDSFLKGTGSTNLVNPMNPIEPQFKTLESLAIIDKIPVILPKPLTHELNQRPLLR